jgi:hypothetical protein
MNGKAEEIKSGRNCSYAQKTVTCYEAGQINKGRKMQKVYSVI